MVHNDHVQVIQEFGDVTDDIEENLKYMTTGHLGGAKFEGLITEFEVFGRPFSEKELLAWTLCENKVLHNSIRI